MKKKGLFILLFTLLSTITMRGNDSGECFVILIEKAAASGQRYHFYDNQFTGADVKSTWANGRHMLALKNTKVGWLAISQAKKSGVSQSYVYDSFKNIKKECEENAKEKQYVSSLAIGDVSTRWFWWAFFNSSTDITRQVVEMVSCKDMEKWMEKQGQQGLKVTSCVRKFGDCAVVAQDGNDIDQQKICFYKNAEEALDDIQHKWKEGWRVGIIDVSMMNKYLIIYNTYKNPRDGEQYVAYCDSRESAEKFMQTRTGNGYHITQVGGSYYAGPKDENGNRLSFTEILSGLITTVGNLYTSNQPNNNASVGNSSDDESDDTSSCRTQEDYQKEYDKWANKVEKSSMKWYKNKYVDSQNFKQGQITAGERKIIRGYQKLMRNVAAAASKKGFTLKRSEMEDFNP